MFIPALCIFSIFIYVEILQSLIFIRDRFHSTSVLNKRPKLFMVMSYISKIYIDFSVTADKTC